MNIYRVTQAGRSGELVEAVSIEAAAEATAKRWGATDAPIRVIGTGKRLGVWEYLDRSNGCPILADLAVRLVVRPVERRVS